MVTHLVRIQMFAVCFALAAALARAQQPSDPRVAVMLSGGLASLSDAVGAQCGNRGNGGGGGGPEFGLAVLSRIHRWLAVEADTRALKQLSVGCYAVGFQVDTTYARDLRRDPAASSTIRVALETPPGVPLFRATLGGGVIWGVRPIPLGVFSAAWSTRGQGTRFFAEVERQQIRVHAVERHHGWASQTPDVNVPIVIYPTSHTVRLGFEIPVSDVRRR